MLQSDSILDANEEAQLEAAIKASLTAHPAPSTSSQSAPSSDAPCIDVDSEDTDADSEDLETFTGSEDESSDTPNRGKDRGGGVAGLESAWVGLLLCM